MFKISINELKELLGKSTITLNGVTFFGDNMSPLNEFEDLQKVLKVLKYDQVDIRPDRIQVWSRGLGLVIKPDDVLWNTSFEEEI